MKPGIYIASKEWVNAQFLSKRFTRTLRVKIKEDGQWEFVDKKISGGAFTICNRSSKYKITRVKEKKPKNWNPTHDSAYTAERKRIMGSKKTKKKKEVKK